MPITLVAHRGFPACYPENTMRGFQAAVDCGATILETDIQLSRDRQPMLLHDATLVRTSGQPGAPWDYDADALSKMSASETARWGDRFVNCTIPTLDQFVAWFDAVDGKTQALIELKPESLEHFGTSATIQATFSRLRPVLDRCTVISKHYDCLARVRHWLPEHETKIGWVLPEWSDANRQLADQLDPELILCNYRRLPDRSQLWPGPWTWMAYTIDDVPTALAVASQGVTVIETNDIETLMNDPRIEGASP